MYISTQKMFTCKSNKICSIDETKNFNETIQDETKIMINKIQDDLKKEKAIPLCK